MRAVEKERKRRDKKNKEEWRRGERKKKEKRFFRERIRGVGSQEQARLYMMRQGRLRERETEGGRNKVQRKSELTGRMEVGDVLS